MLFFKKKNQRICFWKKQAFLFFSYYLSCLIASLLFIYLPTLTASLQLLCTKMYQRCWQKISALNSYYNVNISHMNPKCLSLWSARINFSKWSLHASAFYIFYKVLVYFHFDWPLSDELEIQILDTYYKNMLLFLLLL